jgi:transcriptional regulator with XRE-family HTH domain
MIMEQNAPPIGEFIENVLSRKGMSKAEFGRRISTTRQNVSLILKKDHLDTEMLWRISAALETNFFALYSMAFGGGSSGQHFNPETGKMELRIEIGDRRQAHLTADLLESLRQPNASPFRE